MRLRVALLIFMLLVFMLTKLFIVSRLVQFWISLGRGSYALLVTLVLFEWLIKEVAEVILLIIEILQNFIILLTIVVYLTYHILEGSLRNIELTDRVKVGWIVS